MEYNQKLVELNYFNATLLSNEVELNYIDFKDEEQLRELRDNNPEDYFMHSKDKIYLWGESVQQDYKSITVNVDNDGYLIEKIISEVLLRQFYNDRANFLIRKKMHTYEVTLINKNLFEDKFIGLSAYKTFHLHFSPIQVNTSKFIGLSISMSISENVTWDLDDFAKNNIPYEDLKYNSETRKVFINSKTKYRIAHALNYASKLKLELDRLNWIQNEYQDIHNFCNSYLKQFVNNNSFPEGLIIIDLSNFIFTQTNTTINNDFLQYSILNTPECYFYNGKYFNSTSITNNRNKISYNRPFSYDEFENRQINISIIYLKSEHNSVSKFFKSVQNELINTFKIKKGNFKYTTFEMDDISLSSYQKQIRAVSKSRPDLVVVIIDESHEALSAANSPYFFCKSEFIKQGINTQEIQIQQVRKFINDKLFAERSNSRSRNYTDHNLALNIYAKLGGMAWTIKPNEPKNELVIGIGATTNYEGEPILGLTSVFRGDGKYLFGKASSVTNMKNYEESLEEIITSAIQNCIDNSIINPNENLYLSFHIFKQAGKDNEIKALKQSISRFRNLNFQYTFIHIGEGHNFKFFTYNQLDSGLSFTLKNNQGQNIRGTFIKLTNQSAFLGLKPNNSSFLKIDVHKDSNYIDLEYSANQIYQFAEISHTSYNKSGKPVTIKYPNLMAYFAEKLNEVNGFYLDEIEMPDNSLWFI